MSRHLAIVAVLALAGCINSAIPHPAGPTAAIGQTASVGGVRVRPIRLIEDSRCPARVQCIWAGRLRIEAGIRLRGSREELRREMRLGEAIVLPDGKLTLSAAAPAPQAGVAPAPGAYRFTFELDR